MVKHSHLDALAQDNNQDLVLGQEEEENQTSSEQRDIVIESKLTSIDKDTEYGTPNSSHSIYASPSGKTCNLPNESKDKNKDKDSKKELDQADKSSSNRSLCYNLDSYKNSSNSNHQTTSSAN
eukprot:CAMPEP_0116895658 /NCGR_PEP_ID=MMETSP0467-20121206/5125_1 /TAXON_ID=283647 /ORGANISM="Mesodinium pulex, Strain SPMC105" /LENGTH=122 /DNA_ID=CAMNT_0004566495 /DNA_START=995 /DNA_END=1363 /DNA_ORIENTATION=-